MVRSRPADSRTGAVPPPRPAFRSLRPPLLCAIALVATGCASSAGRSAPPPAPAGVPSGAARLLTTPPPGRAAGAADLRASSGRPHASPAGVSAPAEAFAASLNDFYEAALRADPTYPPYVASLVPGGPVYESALSYLTALAVQGIVGPPRWRIGRVHVVRMTRTSAVVEACSYDTGSRVAATGASGPASFGGGAGYTAYRSVLRRVGQHWRVWKTATTSVAAPASIGAGPCRGW